VAITSNMQLKIQMA